MIRRFLLRLLHAKTICKHNNSSAMPFRYSVLDLNRKALPLLLSEWKCRDCGEHWSYLIDSNAEEVTVDLERMVG